MTQQKRSPEDQRLEMFIGKWQNSGRVLPGPLGPGGDVVGTTSFIWGVSGKWLQYISVLEIPGIGEYEVQGGVAFNIQTNKYDAYAINNMGALMVYEGEWVNDTTLTFILTHPHPGRAQVVYQKLSKGLIQMNSDTLAEDGEFESYFITNLAREK